MTRRGVRAEARCAIVIGAVDRVVAGVAGVAFERVVDRVVARSAGGMFDRVVDRLVAVMAERTLRVLNRMASALAQLPSATRI
jgi:hypothetical protein